jgi:hypothetical protein
VQRKHPGQSLFVFASLRKINLDCKYLERVMPVIKSTIGLVLTVVIAISVGGCDSSGSSKGGASMDQMAGAVDAQKVAEKQKQESDAAAKAAADKKAAEEQAAQPPAEPEKKVVGRAPVAPGGGYYSAIIGARRHILNETENLAWKQAVGSFRATNGRKPKDHNEFMKSVIAAMEIPLPHKEENEEFFYDPNGESDGDFGQLYVIEKPAPGSVPTQSTPPAGGPAPGTAPAPAPAAK